MSLLEVEGLEAGYGAAQALFGVSLRVGRGELVAMTGRNGMGKTTTIRAVTGLIAPWAGRVRVAGRDLTGAPAHRVGQAGVGLAPEGRRVFATLTVEENLRAAASTRHGRRWGLSEVYAFLPRLSERRRQRGGSLSGGEQQMLALGRALMTNPRLLVLDEATEGLAPLIRREIWGRLAALKAEGLAILVVDKDLAALSRLADRCVVLEKGEAVMTLEGGAGGLDVTALEDRLRL